EADDRIVINGLGGDDVITASGLTGMLLTENGGDGDDVLVGSPGNDTLNGGNGDDVLLGRAGLADVTRRFDITWFLGAIHKYRYLLSEVRCGASFRFGLRPSGVPTSWPFCRQHSRSWQR